VLRLGNSRIDAATVRDDLGTFAAINGAIKPSGDLLFYGCDLAAGEKGEEFLDILAANTHVDVAASEDVTGNDELGGDWDLEIHKGRIGTSQPFAEKALKNFSAVLAPTLPSLVKVTANDACGHKGGSNPSTTYQGLIFAISGTIGYIDCTGSLVSMAVSSYY